MEELLRIIFQDILHKEEEIKQIATIDDLCETTWYTSKLIRVLAAVCGERQGYGMKEILTVANEVYQGVCSNA